MRKIIITVCLVSFICTSLPAVVFAEPRFARIKGRALKFGIPLYQGIPPEVYSYKSLGDVVGEYKAKFLFDSAASTMSNALENLADKAKELGANAVIKIKSSTTGFSFTYEGEAVIFDELPDR